MKIAYIAQARMTSTRLPGKIALDMCGESVLQRMIERMRLSRHNIDIIIATTTNKQDDIVEEVANKCSVKVFRGSEDNVLSRFYYAAKEYGVDVIGRITCDDILFDPRWLFDDLMDEFLSDGSYDYYNASCFNDKTNSWDENEPCCGCNVEIFSFKALERSMKEAKDPYCLEHVTPFMYMNPDMFHCGGHGSGYNGPNILPEKFGTSLDTEKDLQLLRNIYGALCGEKNNFTILDVIDVCLKHPEWQSIIEDISRTPVTYRGEGDKNTGWTWR